MQLDTDTFSLTLDDRQFELRKTEATKDEDVWVHTKKGDATTQKLQLRVSGPAVNVFLNGLDIGSISKSDAPALKKLNDLVTAWIKDVGPVDNQTARISELMVHKQRLAKQTPVSVQALTWNVNGFLAQAGGSTWDVLDPEQDIIALGFQETDQLSTNLTSNSQTLQVTLDAIAQRLPGHKMMAQIQLLGLMSIVYIKESLVPYITRVSTLSSGTGFLRMWGNKGAVLIRFALFHDSIMGGGTVFSIVNCHLSAGEGMSQVGRRRWELREISQRFDIPLLSLDSFEHEFDNAAEEYADLALDDDEPEVPARYHRQDPVNGTNGANEPDKTLSGGQSKEPVSQSPQNEPESKTNDTKTPASKPKKGKKGKKGKKSRGEVADQVPEPEQENDAEPEPVKSSETGPKDDPEPERASSVDSTEKHVRFSGILEYDNVEEAEPLTDHDTQDQVTIVMGDLNYRTLLESGQSRQLIQSRQYGAVLDHDSLRREMKGGHILKDFEEGEINFPPTFKYGRDSNQYVVRVPSYTDRILYRSANKVEVKSYQSFDVRLSDHRPVAAEFEISASAFDFDERGKVLDRVLRLVDHAENTAQPRLEVSTQVIDRKGPVLSTVSAWVTLTSKSNRAIRWTVQHGNKIEVTPSSGILLRENEKKQVLVKAQLRVGTGSISDVLVIKPSGGADMFVSVDFAALPSCLGSSLEDMCCMPHGARNERTTEPTTNLPKQIWSCINYLWTRVDPEMLSEPGEPSLIQQVLEWLDTGSELDEEVLDTANSTADGAGIRAVSSVLVLLFQYLPVPPIPLNHVPPCARGLSILERVPSVSANVIIYLLGFVRHASDFGLSREAAMAVLDPMLMGPGDGERSRRRDIVKSLLS